jgi:hypothetical protein
VRRREEKNGAHIETAGGARSANVQRTREPYDCRAAQDMCGQWYSFYQDLGLGRVRKNTMMLRMFNIDRVEAAMMALAWQPLCQSWGFWAKPGRTSPITWM